MNPYIEYYTHQAGTGLAGFQGIRYQRGSGFLGRLLSKAVFPLMRFFGKRAAITGANIASDVLLNNKNLKESAKARLTDEGKNIANVGLEKAKEFIEGRGIKRKSIKVQKKRKLLKIDDLLK